MNDIWTYVRGGKGVGSHATAKIVGFAQALKPQNGKQKEYTSNRHTEVGTKRQRPALENITNQAKNTTVTIPTGKQKASKKSKTQATKAGAQGGSKSKQQQRNAYSTRRKRKSSVSDSVVPDFADMDISATPSAPSAGNKKRNQTKDLIAKETMRMENSSEDDLECKEDKMEEEIINAEEQDGGSEEDNEEEEEEEDESNNREREERRKDKIMRQKQESLVVVEKEDVDILPAGAHDIDALDEADPQWATAYVNQIYDNLRDNERKHMASVTNYIDTVQKAITPAMRGVLVDWLVEVAEEYELSSETLYLSANYLDRFLSIQTVDRRRFQLVGVACMLIASKYEEIYAPAIDDFVYISANTYKREEILLMEVLILNTLNFDLTAATAKVFLRRFLKAAGADLTLAFLASYLSELTLQEYTFVKYLPSLVAAAAVFLALRTLGRDPWSPTLQYYTKYNIEEPVFQQCIHELYKVHVAAPTNSLKAIYEKYSDTRFRRVAKLPPPVVDPYSGN